MKFDSFHPAVNCIYFVVVIGCSIAFSHPVFVGIAWLCAFLFSIKLNGKRAVIFNGVLIPLAIVYAMYYAYYNHFGITNLQSNFIGNRVTLEALVYGLMNGIRIMTVIMWFSCVFAVVTSDKIIYLFGKISLF